MSALAKIKKHYLVIARKNGLEEKIRRNGFDLMKDKAGAWDISQLSHTSVDANDMDETAFWFQTYPHGIRIKAGDKAVLLSEIPRRVPMKNLNPETGALVLLPDKKILIRS